MNKKTYNGQLTENAHKSQRDTTADTGGMDGTMNLEQARFNMIEQQIRTWEVLDDKILALLDKVPREDFVPPEYRSLAYADTEIPIGHGQKMMPPKLEARILQALEIQEDDDILEIGTGSGYLTALLARLGKHVYSVDLFPEFTADAQRKLDRADIRHVTLETGNAATGWPKHAPYDVIVPTGSYPLFPEELPRELKRGGRMVVIVGEAPVMEAILVQRTTDDAISKESLFETEVAPLLHVPRPQRFVF